MRPNKRLTWLPTLLGFLLLALLIQLAGSLQSSAVIFPGVPAILRRFLELVTGKECWIRIGTTLIHLLESLLIASAVGLAIGTADGMSPFFSRMIRPMMILLRSLPMIVLVIIIMVLANYASVPLIATSIVLIPIISEAVAEGIRRIEPELIDVYRMNSSLTPLVFVRVHLPLISGYARQAFTNAVGMGAKVAVTTEYLVQSRNSLGKAVFSSFYFSEYADIYAYALIMALLILALTGLPRFVSARFRRGEYRNE